MWRREGEVDEAAWSRSVPIELPIEIRKIHHVHAAGSTTRS